ncbi:hypothetical protein MKW98_008712 [Papaver atlanticum]|uniref:Bromo domain-containing protein n=1 Tax=Papaver atlanticum TaxID=357466 RepID=A0AAD4THI6_9MAGN|nr:hypothetical protein MKW98_008712 [Papaver atlanticum]
MGKIVEEKPKKKKGRPSLLDLQKRKLLQQQQEQQELQKKNPNFFGNIIPNSNGKIDGGDEDDDEVDGNGKRKEKKLQFVVKLKNSQQQQQNPFLNTNSYNSESNLLLDDGNGENPYKKRKINDVVGDGSAQFFDQTGEKHNFNLNSASNTHHQGLPLESGPTTPLPDKKLLFFILDRLQKKDTYSVFSEPVDPEELPDYFEIIQHPMDFGTVRKKLDVGAYASLEQFEKDVFLICSNAMEYNAPDTIYFRQARSINELAKKDFENLRQDNTGPEAQPRVVRRGRPPKHLKKPEIFSDAALATGVDNSIFSNSYNLRKGPVSINNDTLAKTRYKEASWSTERKWDRNDDFSGLTFKAMSMKIGKKQIILDENRRNTYFQQPGGCVPSIFTILVDEEKQLINVGLHVERGYAESMARFAGNLGPTAWKVAAKKISRTLPAGTNFGPGWVEEKEVVPPHLQMPQSMCSPQRPPPHPQQQLFSVPQISPSATTSLMEVKGDKLLDNHEFADRLRSDMHLIRSFPSSSTSVPSSIFMNKAPESIVEHQTSTMKGPQTGFDSMNSSSSSGIKHSQFPIHQNPVMLTPALNGFTSGFGYNPANQMANHWQTRHFSSEGSARIPDVLSGSNLANSVGMNHFESEEHRFLAPSGIASPMNFSMSLSGAHHNEAPAVSGNTGMIHMHPNWRGIGSSTSSLQQQQKQISVPPDLNVMFQLPSSPNPNLRGDSPQPDLALQL